MSSLPKSSGENCVGIEALLQEQVALQMLVGISFQESSEMSFRERRAVLDYAAVLRSYMFGLDGKGTANA